MAQPDSQIISPRTLAIISAVLMIPAVILFFVDYRAGLALLVGVIIAWVLFLVARWVTRIRVTALVIIGVVIVLAVVVIAVVTLLGPTIGNVFSNIIVALPGVCSSGYGLVVSDLSVTVDGKNLASGVVVISGHVTGNKGGEPARTIDIPPLTMKTESRGFMLREVTFNLTDVLPRQVEGYSGYCLADAKIRLELQNFPRGSFYQARDAKDIELTSYLDTETIKWTPPESDVAFSYIPPGWGIMRPIVDLLYGAQTFDKLALGAVGSLGTLILGTVVEVVVGRFVKKPLEKLIDRKEKDAPKT